MWTRTRAQLGIPLLGVKVPRADEVITHTEAGADMPATATVAQEIARIKAIDSFHRALGWGGYGYQGTACQSGRAYEGREAGRSGAHTKNQNHKPAIVILGHGDRTAMSPAAIVAHRRIQQHWITTGHLTDRPKVTGHRDYANKSCPGNLVYPQLSQLRGVTTSLPPPDPDPDPLPPEEIDVKLFRIDGGKTVYVTDGSTRGHIHSRDVMEAMGWKMSQVEDLPADHVLAQLPELTPLVLLARTPSDTTVWEFAGNPLRRRRIASRSDGNRQLRDGDFLRIPADHWLWRTPEV